MKLMQHLIVWQFLWAPISCFSLWKGVHQKSLDPIPLNLQDVQHEELLAPTSFSQSRATFCHHLLALFTAIDITHPISSYAFEGGVGGLGKTKPSTGVEFFEEDATPIQNAQGVIQAEITSATGKPMLVQFQSPWPLLSTGSGLESRDIRSSESAFIQVLTLSGKSDWRDRKAFTQLLLDTVLGSQGKFGAYGTPVDVKVKTLKSQMVSVDSNDVVFSVSFTSYTPSMRESERQLWIKPKQLDESTLVLLVTGTTSLRFPSQESTFQRVLDSFEVVLAPESRFRKDFKGLEKERRL